MAAFRYPLSLACCTASALTLGCATAPEAPEASQAPREPRSLPRIALPVWPTPRAHKARDEVLERFQRIAEELESIEDCDWAGSYSDGGFLMGKSLHVSPDAGAVFVFQGCMGLMDVNLGEVSLVERDRIWVDWRFDPERQIIYEHFRPQPEMDHELAIVRWGERRYLVPMCRVVAFCNAFNAGSLATGGELVLEKRQGDGESAWLAREKATPEGLPQVPDEYRDHLLETPLRGEITAVEAVEPIAEMADGTWVWQARVAVDLGLRDGLLPGMTLWTQEPPPRWPGEVVEAESRSAAVELRMPTFSGRALELPRVGQDLSTRDPRP